MNSAAMARWRRRRSSGGRRSSSRQSAAIDSSSSVAARRCSRNVACPDRVIRQFLFKPRSDEPQDSASPGGPRARPHRLWHDMPVRGVMTISPPGLVVLHEHPEWQKPLFAALERRGRAVRPVRRHPRGLRQRRAAARRPLFQPGQSKCVSARAHTSGSPRAGLHAIAGASGRARPERRQRFRARAEQERPGDAAAHARHRLPAFDHLQRRRRPSYLRGT